MARYILKLYVTGQTPQSQRAIKNLNEICEKELAGDYEIELIDILKSPALAEQDKILATPTVIRKLPEPIRMVIGDLSNRTEVLYGLDIVEKGAC